MCLLHRYLLCFDIQFHIKLQTEHVARKKGMKMQFYFSRVAQQLLRLDLPERVDSIQFKVHVRRSKQNYYAQKYGIATTHMHYSPSMSKMWGVRLKKFQSWRWNVVINMKYWV